MPFLYGGNVVKAHVGRWSEDCPEHSGVIVYSQDDTPLGFGGRNPRSLGSGNMLKYDSVGAINPGSQEAGSYGYCALQTSRRWRVSP